MAIDLTDPIFTDENAARAHFEKLRWPDGPVCPHCGSVDSATELKGKSTRPGVYKCHGCKKPFTATVGTLYERSHIPLHKWLLATHLMCASKKGMSARINCTACSGSARIGRLGSWHIASAKACASCIPRAAARLAARTRWLRLTRATSAARRGTAKARSRPKRPWLRWSSATGRVRSHHVPDVTAKTLRPILKAQLDRRSYVMTDEGTVYPPITGEFAGHGTVNHSIEEYVRGGFWHTNTVESYFSILKRGITGTYHHVSARHLKRYLGEFDFRHNERAALGTDDAKRAKKAVVGIAGKRLTYRQPDRRAAG